MITKNKNKNTEPERAYTDVEVAKLWSMALVTIRVWRTNNKGPRYVKFGRSVRYLASDLKAFELASLVTAR